MNYNIYSKEDYFNIAKIIDNNFIGTESTFSAERKDGYHLLTTNKCDDCSIVKIYSDANSADINKIERIGSDTESYEEITKHTYERIKLFIKNLFPN